MQSRKFSDEGEWIEAAVAELRGARDAAAAEGRRVLHLCLAGGTTPSPAYAAMAALPLRGMRAELWLGDERAVPSGRSERNDAMIERAFARCAWDPPARLRPWPLDPEGLEGAEAARLYEAEIRGELGEDPAFDLAILGLGADGHTASLFPGALWEARRGEGPITALAESPLEPRKRLTLTPRALLGSRRILFLVRGRDKLPALRALEAADPRAPASIFALESTTVLYLE